MANSDFILQGFMPRTHTEVLQRLLDLKELEHCILSSAFVNSGGVDLIANYIKPVAKHVTVYAGIRNDITSRQSLEALLGLGINLYVVDTGSRRLIFHPKIYAARSKTVGHLLIGSANMTAGGFNNNIEGGVSVDLDLNDASDAKLYKSIEDEFAGLPKKFPKHVLQIKTASELQKLEDEDRLLDESKVEPPRPITISKGNGSGDTLERIKLAVKPVFRAVKKAPKPKPPTPSPKVVDDTQVEPSTSVGWVFLWESTDLTRRDLNIPKGNDNTNVTGSINLDKGKLDAEIDHRHYFRDEVFQSLDWKTTKVATVDEAHATFQLVIKGVDHGEFVLRIAHTTSTDSAAYAQRNAMTRLSWGAVKPFIAKEQYIDRTMLLYRDSNDPQHFMIEID